MNKAKKSAKKFSPKFAIGDRVSFLYCEQYILPDGTKGFYEPQLRMTGVIEKVYPVKGRQQFVLYDIKLDPLYTKSWALWLNDGATHAYGVVEYTAKMTLKA